MSNKDVSHKIKTLVAKINESKFVGYLAFESQLLPFVVIGIHLESYAPGTNSCLLLEGLPHRIVEEHLRTYPVLDQMTEPVHMLSARDPFGT